MIGGTYLCHSVQFVINLRVVPWRSGCLGSVALSNLATGYKSEEIMVRFSVEARGIPLFQISDRLLGPPNCTVVTFFTVLV